MTRGPGRSAGRGCASGNYFLVLGAELAGGLNLR